MLHASSSSSGRLLHAICQCLITMLHHSVTDTHTHRFDSSSAPVARLIPRKETVIYHGFSPFQSSAYERCITHMNTRKVGRQASVVLVTEEADWSGLYNKKNAR